MDNGTSNILDGKKVVYFELGVSKNKNSNIPVSEVWSNTFFLYKTLNVYLIYMIVEWIGTFAMLAIFIPLALSASSFLSALTGLVFPFALALFFSIFIFIYTIVIFIKVLNVIDKFQFKSDTATFFKNLKTWCIVWFVCFLLTYFIGISIFFAFIFLIISISKSKQLLIDIERRYEIEDFYPPSFKFVKNANNRDYFKSRAEKRLRKIYNKSNLDKNS